MEASINHYNGPLWRALHCPYYILAWLPLHSHYNGELRRVLTALTKALHRGLNLAIILDRYGGPHTVLTIALHGGLYLAILMDRYIGLHTSLTIALHGGL
jgi:hypothetical protein